MADLQKTLAYGIQQKTEIGRLDPASPVPFGPDFNDVVDTRKDKGNYTLRQFFDNYMDFIKTVDFFYYGTETPTNSHMKIWIDTGHRNQDYLS